MSKRHTVSAPTPEDEALRARAAADHIRQSPEVEFTEAYKALAARAQAPRLSEAEDFSDLL